MKPIVSKNPTLREFLSRSEYEIPVYERGFVWNDGQITDFVSSIVDSFFASYMRTDGKAQVPEFEYHFLGTFWLVRENGKNIICDGKQRLISILLMFIYASKVLAGYGDVKLIKDMIRWSGVSDGAFNLKVPGAHNCLLALMGEPVDPAFPVGAIDRSLRLGYGLVSQLLNCQLGDPKVMHVFAHWLSIRTVLVLNTVQAGAVVHECVFHTLNISGRPILRGEANNGIPVPLDPSNSESEPDATV